VKFDIEKTHLTITAREPRTSEKNFSWSFTEARTVDEALLKFAKDDQAEIVGEVFHFGGSQAVATVSKGREMYMVQLYPSAREGV
jgi:hypothetical protein